VIDLHPTRWQVGDYVVAGEAYGKVRGVGMELLLVEGRTTLTSHVPLSGPFPPR